MNYSEFKENLERLIDINVTDFLLGYSGGVDSHVLLFLMHQLRSLSPHVKLTAIHINHNLSHNSPAWVVHCQNICSQLEIPLLIFPIVLNLKKGMSLEEAARNERYRVFFDQMQSAETCLLTAHHQNDQAETVLIQLLRGAGPKGLAAMPQIQKFSHGKLIRPLLNVTRKEINHFAEQNKLNWINDESNQDFRFARNFLRDKITPILEDQWPSFGKSLSRSARHCAETSKLLEDLAEIDLNQLQNQSNSIDAGLFLKLSFSRQSNLLRYWIQKCRVRVPNESKLHAFIKMLQQAGVDKSPKIVWEGVELFKQRNQIYLLPKDNNSNIPVGFQEGGEARASSRSGAYIEYVSSEWQQQSQNLKGDGYSLKKIIWDLKGPLMLPNQLGILSVREHVLGGLDPAIRFKPLEVRFRSQGEKIQPVGSPYRKSLKKLFQEWNIPAWQRSQIPLLYLDGKLISVIGYCISQEIVATQGLGLEISWKKNNDHFDN